MKTLNDWLGHIEHLHSKIIDMGLERMLVMNERMGIKFDCPVFIVGGTNGKGSVCAYLEAALLSAGYKTMLHTSPHLFRFNERARINGRYATDEELIPHFEKVERLRGDLTPSYFEFSLLAILSLFQSQKPDAVILEVGLGGRLDAVNTIEPSVSIVTSIGIDHVAYLGDTREKIAWDKAHIYRTGRPAVCGDRNPPSTLIGYAREIRADLRVAGVNFDFQENGGGWTYRDSSVCLENLPYPKMQGKYQLSNASAMICALLSVSGELPIERRDIEHALGRAELTGRFQTVGTDPEIIVDVGHNPHAAKELADTLRRTDTGGRTIAVCGMLSDKDRRSVCAIMKDVVSEWFLGDLGTVRGGKAADLAGFLEEAGVSRESVNIFPSVEAALLNAQKEAVHPDRIIAFGSFLTVTEVLKTLHVPVK